MKERYEEFAKVVNETPAKVENWFKYQRRTCKKTGELQNFKVYIIEIF